MQKHFLIIALLITNCLVIGKSQKLDTFSVTFKTAFKDSIKYTDWKAFRDTFYILKNGVKLPFEAYRKSKNGKNIKVLGLTKGNYVVRYENIFSQLIDKPITINRKKLKNTRIYLDEFIDTVKMSFFEGLKNGDTLGISFNEIIHEGSTRDSLAIIKNKSVLTARLLKFINDVDRNGLPATEYLSFNERQILLVKVKILTANDILLLEHIFKILMMPQADCLPIQRDYGIYLNNKLIRSIKNDQCDWNSFDYIKDKIFGIKWNNDYYKK